MKEFSGPHVVPGPQVAPPLGPSPIKVVANWRCVLGHFLQASRGLSHFCIFGSFGFFWHFPPSDIVHAAFLSPFKPSKNR